MSKELKDILRILQSERRRIVLELLLDLQIEEGSETVTVRVSDLGRQVAAEEADVDSESVGRTVQRSSDIGLKHTHLPMLDDYGVVNFDEHAMKVSSTNQTEPLAQLMKRIVDVVDESEIRITGSYYSDRVL
ncbi:DUF7344 domain-containing protein [Halovivax gelatinilyticus]|uniref:DUF7344 domain-containing protein n=1 Tax=Halovivax gelatinilyticus TaxID=2961597 RepID=UPI0020CA5991|nr:hypothetical protein [Halovivax gelatinilyticus]